MISNTSPSVFRGYHRGSKLRKRLTSILRRRETILPLPNLRILTIQFIYWPKSLTTYLPNLTELDISRVDFGVDDLCRIIQHLNPQSLKRLTVDGVSLCPGFFAVVVSFSNLEYLSLADCRISRDALAWFMGGKRVPQIDAGCSALPGLFEERAGAVMSSLRDLDLTNQAGLDFNMLSNFHTQRLNRLAATSPLAMSTDAACARPHPIHFNLQGCYGLGYPPLWIFVGLSDVFPETRITPQAF